MAIDSEAKRSAMMSFGMPWLAGVRPPTGIIDAFARTAMLAGYYIVPAPVTFGYPDRGWEFTPTETVFEFQVPNAVFSFGPSETVFYLED